MTNKLRRKIRAAAFFGVASLLAMPSMASAQEAPGKDEVFKLIPPGSEPTISIPGLGSFDISWVDTSINRYFLADRSLNQVDVIETGTNPPGAHTTIGHGDFAGLQSSNDISGPNGVLTLLNGSTHELWVGDAPAGEQPALCGTQFPSGAALTRCSTVKIFNAESGGTPTIISTRGSARADELCFDPKDSLVLVANDADTPAFITFISTETHAIKLQIAIPEASNGIEQCQWSPRTGMFYLNIPDVGGAGDDKTPGAVYVFSPQDVLKGITKPRKTFTIPIADCAGPQGMAIWPDKQILLGCNAPSIPSGDLNSVIINENTGSVIATLPDEGGADEVWFNQGDGHYFIAQGNDTDVETHAPEDCPASTPSRKLRELGVVDAQGHRTDQTVCFGPSAASTHSVAADATTNLVFVPRSGGVDVFEPTCPPPAHGKPNKACKDDNPAFVSRHSD